MFWYRPFSPTCTSTSSKSIELIFPAIPRLCRVSTVWPRRRRWRRSCTMRRWRGTPSNYTAWPPSLILEGSHAELQTHVSRPLRLKPRAEEVSSSLAQPTLSRLFHPRLLHLLLFLLVLLVRPLVLLPSHCLPPMYPRVYRIGRFQDVGRLPTIRTRATTPFSPPGMLSSRSRTVPPRSLLWNLTNRGLSGPRYRSASGCNERFALHVSCRTNLVESWWTPTKLPFRAHRKCQDRDANIDQFSQSRGENWSRRKAIVALSIAEWSDPNRSFSTWPHSSLALTAVPRESS